MMVPVGRQRGFSLLEVIIATGILATSSVLLLTLFSTGEQHASRAEKRVLAQMMCQSKLDELLANPILLRHVADEPLDGHPNWSYSVDWTPTQVEGLVQLQVSIGEITSANQRELDDQLDRRPAFELVRWLRYDPASVEVNPSQTSDSTW